MILNDSWIFHTVHFCIWFRSEERSVIMQEEAADLPSTVYKKDNGAAFCFCSRCGCWPSIFLLLTIHRTKRPKPNNAHCSVSQCCQALLNPLKESIDTYWKTLRWFICWIVSRMTQKTTEPISTDLGWRMALGPEETTLTFGADPDKEKGMNSEGTMRGS